MDVILMATNNPRKQAEIRGILVDIADRLVSPADVGLALEVDETGGTFYENAALKARVFATATGLAVLADDSGLVVDALNGEPGVRSARFGGLATPAERNRLLLDKLSDVPDERRTAQFVSVVAFCSNNGDLRTAEGRLRGTITRELRGENGFGYDPLFLVPELGRTLAELSSDQKNALSHRRIALENIRHQMQTYFCRLLTG
jgi:XTP/dITP diphosphohydrolase